MTGAGLIFLGIFLSMGLSQVARAIIIASENLKENK